MVCSYGQYGARQGCAFPPMVGGDTKKNSPPRVSEPWGGTKPSPPTMSNLGGGTKVVPPHEKVVPPHRLPKIGPKSGFSRQFAPFLRQFLVSPPPSDGGGNQKCCPPHDVRGPKIFSPHGLVGKQPIPPQQVCEHPLSEKTPKLLFMIKNQTTQR